MFDCIFQRDKTIFDTYTNYQDMLQAALILNSGFKSILVKRGYGSFCHGAPHVTDFHCQYSALQYFFKVLKWNNNFFSAFTLTDNRESHYFKRSWYGGSLCCLGRGSSTR